MEIGLWDTLLIRVCTDRQYGPPPFNNPRRYRQMIRIAKAVLVTAAVACLMSCSSAETAQSAQGMGGGAFPPVPVSISQASEEMVPIELKAFGTVEAFSSVDVKSQVAGPLLSVKF